MRGASLLHVWDRIIPLQQSQYHGCWGPGSFRRQDISTYDVDFVE